MGPSVQKYLPDELNPKIKEQLDNEMGAPPGAGPPPPAAATSSSAAPAPAKKTANASRKKSDAAKGAQQSPAATSQRDQPQAEDHALAGNAWLTCVLHIPDAEYRPNVCCK